MAGRSAPNYSWRPHFTPRATATTTAARLDAAARIGSFVHDEDRLNPSSSNSRGRWRASRRALGLSAVAHIRRPSTHLASNAGSSAMCGACSTAAVGGPLHRPQSRVLGALFATPRAGFTRRTFDVSQHSDRARRH